MQEHSQAANPKITRLQGNGATLANKHALMLSEAQPKAVYHRVGGEGPAQLSSNVASSVGRKRNES